MSLQWTTNVFSKEIAQNIVRATDYKLSYDYKQFDIIKQNEALVCFPF
jgi:hypothetical protein